MHIKTIKKISAHSFLVNDCAVISINAEGNFDLNYDESLTKEEAEALLDKFLEFAK